MTERMVPLELLEDCIREAGYVENYSLVKRLRAIIDSPGVDPVPASFLQICKEEAERSALTNIPMKYEFMRSNGMTSLDEVHEWMIRTQDKFVRAVVAQQRTKK